MRVGLLRLGRINFMLIVLCPRHLLVLRHMLVVRCRDVPSSCSSVELRSLLRGFILCHHGLYILHLVHSGHLPGIGWGVGVPQLCRRHVPAFNRGSGVDGLLKLRRGLSVCN